MNYAYRVPIIMNWLGRQSLQFIEVHTQTEQETCKMLELNSDLNIMRQF